MCITAAGLRILHVAQIVIKEQRSNSMLQKMEEWYFFIDSKKNKKKSKIFFDLQNDFKIILKWFLSIFFIGFFDFFVFDFFVFRCRVLHDSALSGLRISSDKNKMKSYLSLSMISNDYWNPLEIKIIDHRQSRIFCFKNRFSISDVELF